MMHCTSFHPMHAPCQLKKQEAGIKNQTLGFLHDCAECISIRPLFSSFLINIIFFPPAYIFGFFQHWWFCSCTPCSTSPSRSTRGVGMQGFVLLQAEAWMRVSGFCLSHYSKCITCVTQLFFGCLGREAFKSSCNNNPVSLRHMALLL